ncbi:MAG: hypothetical protein GKS05_00445 [Nitrospirales bacterium]|nr:hypothetical protein [Nitrospirales bacterium]
MAQLEQTQRIATLERGLRRVRHMLDRGIGRSRQVSRWRFVFFLIGVVVCFGLYKAAWHVTGNITLGGFFVLFLFIAHYHTRFERRLSRLRRWCEIKTKNLARSRLDWISIAPQVLATPGDHPYASDLDISGTHSLFGLVNSTISTNGHERLFQWLCAQNSDPLDETQWHARQALVKELAGLHGFRDRLILEATVVDPETLNGHRIESLLQDTVDIPRLRSTFIVSMGLVGLTGLLGIGAVFGELPGYWIISFAIYAWLFFSMAGRLEPLFGKVLSLEQELQKLGLVLRLLEKRSYRGLPHLALLCGPFVNAEFQPSHAMHRFARLCAGLSIKGHPLVHIGLNALGPWDLWFAYRLQGACSQLRQSLLVWLNQLATLDAAASLAGFAYLHPQYAWPLRRISSVTDHGYGVSARALGHPLIPQDKKVANDVSLEGVGQLLMVTGSNMSGKSTFLRTVGVNVCLAQAGAPVCAEWFEWTWMRLSCCIRVSDSLDEGLSYFYAEVKRLRTVLDAVAIRNEAPVLYLIDEIFKGTNNRERLIGSEAFIRALVRGNGLGLITTHDLELAALEGELSDVINVHFQETVAEGALEFDYQLRPGPCPTTNALRIMAQEGLPIPTMGEQQPETIKEE